MLVEVIFPIANQIYVSFINLTFITAISKDNLTIE
jgi:hypothetical protein